MSIRKKTKLKKDFVDLLSLEQKKAHDKIVNHKPKWGKPVRSSDVCAWFLVNKWPVSRVVDAFDTYVQDCEKSLKKGKKILNMGGYIRKAIIDQRKPKNGNCEINYRTAIKLSKEYKQLIPMQNYANISIGNSINDLYYHMNPQDFERIAKKYLHLGKYYG